VTFLFTDIEGSTALWEHQEAEMDEALARHDEIMRAAISSYDGFVFSTSGDAFAAAFARAEDAVAAVRQARERLDATAWPTTKRVRVRMGMHTGEAYERDGDYFGPVVNRAARIMSAGHGGQTLLSATTASIVGADALVGLGEHRLKDLESVEWLYQLDAPPDRFPPLRTLDHVRNNLPMQRTRLFGREREIGRVLNLMTSNRLVTLTGVGGVGKTRLAVAAAAEAVDTFGDGVFFVDLTTTSSGDQLAGRVAEALGLERGGRTEERLLEYLTQRHVLVVLDNCEHIVDDVAALVDRVLDVDGRARLLATSREDLEVEGERTLRVGTLTVDVGESPGTAVELLVDRAASSGVELAAIADAAPMLREICVRLDGVPLAIELAAAQLAHFSPSELLARLDRRFDLLSGGRRRRRQRQQTLQAVMDWSWGLLDEDEQSLLAQLAVLTGVWGLEEAAGICGADDDFTTASTLRRLVAKSLVQRVGDDPGTAQFRLLETVRLYAQQQLVDRGEADDLRHRHLRWFVERARGEDPMTNMLSLGHVAWYRRSFDNVLAALDWALTVGDHDGAAGLVIAGTSQVFSGVGFVEREVVDVADQLLEVVDDPTTRARLLIAQAWIGWSNFDLGLLHPTADRAVAEARRAGDAFTLVMALAISTFWRVDRERWEANLVEARSIAATSASWAPADVVDAFLDGAHYRWSDMERLAVEAPGRVNRRDVATVMDLANLATVAAAALATEDLELATWAVRERAALEDLFGLGVSWQTHFDTALIAAFDRDVEQARAHLEVTRRLSETGRVGPARGELLLVPAVLALRDDRLDDCAVLLALVRANPVPVGQNGLAVYRHLRRRTEAVLDDERLVAARDAAAQITADTALAAFLVPPEATR
jgi:predicted ATPase